MDIIIFGGQSNMQGESEALTDTEIISNAFEYRYLNDQLLPLKNPVGENITVDKTQGYQYERVTVDQDAYQLEWLKTHVTGSACYGHTNLVPEFCKAYTQATANDVVAVHVARGSTYISHWLPGSIGYELIAEKANAAITKVKANAEVNAVCFVWLQGESDAIVGNSNAYYKEKLAELNEALKKDVGIEKFGIIRVGRFTNDERDLEIISAQDDVCAENDDFLMLTTIATTLNTQEEYMNPQAKGHYSAKGLEKLGREAGKTLGEFVKSKKLCP